MRGYSGRSRRRPSGLIIVGALAAAVLVCGMLYMGVSALLGGEDETAPTTLPPLTSTTTSTTTPVTTTTQPRYYEVQLGDSLFSIAEQFEVRMEDIITLNGITDPDNIPAGEVLQMPPATVLLNNRTTTVAP